MNKFTKILTVSLICLIYAYSPCISYAQTNKLYDVDANPYEQLEKAKTTAQLTHKHVMMQIGGNWCSWCIRFHEFYKNDKELDSLMNANYVIIEVDYNAKKNQDFFAKFGYPQRFGFPVFVITDADGNRIHTQNSWYLEDGGKSYDREKVKAFLNDWSVKSISPETYSKTE
jgi:thioredoxin-related protein